MPIRATYPISRPHIMQSTGVIASELAAHKPEFAIWKIKAKEKLTAYRNGEISADEFKNWFLYLIFHIRLANNS